MNLSPQTLLQSRYEIQKCLIQTDFGAVYSGLDMRLGREVCIRTFPLPPPQISRDYSLMDARISLVASLRHPTLEPFLDMGFHQRLGFVVSEATPTGQLDGMLAEGAVPCCRAIDIALGILKALAAAHQQGAPHGRLTPEAVLVRGRNEVQLRHFAMGPTDILPPDSPYLPPEGGGPTEAADFWACGQLLGTMTSSDPNPEVTALREGLQSRAPESRVVFARKVLEGANPPSLPGNGSTAFPWRRALLVASLLALGVWGAYWAMRPRVASENPAAMAAYRRARFSLGKRTALDMKKAEDSFLECLRLQPKDFQAASGLAVTYALQGVHGVLPADQAADRARAAARSALAIQPHDPEAMAVLAYLAFRFEWKWREADILFKSAAAYGQKDALVRHWYGFYLSAAGRHAEAIKELSEAARLDPVDLQVLTNLGVAQAWSGDMQSGVATLRRVVDLDPTFRSGWDRLVRLLEADGQIPQALEAYRVMVTHGLASPDALKSMEKGYRDGGKDGFYRVRLDQERDRLGGIVYMVLLGRKDEALAAIHACVDRKDLYVIWIPADGAYRGLHGDPRFAVFLKRIGYPGY